MTWFVVSTLAVCVLVLVGFALSRHTNVHLVTQGRGSIPRLVTEDDADQERHWRAYGEALGLDSRPYSHELVAGARIPAFVSGWELVGERRGRAVHVVLGMASFNTGRASETSSTPSFDHRYVHKISVACAAEVSSLEVTTRGGERVTLRGDGVWLHWHDEAPSPLRVDPHPVWGTRPGDSSMDTAQVSHFLDVMLERAAHQEKT